MAEQKRKQLLANSRPPSSSSEDDDRPAFHIHSPKSIAEKFSECMEKNGYLDHKEKGEEADGATHGNDEEEFDFGKWRREQLKEIRRLEEKLSLESDWELIKEMEEQMLDMAKLAIELGHAEILGGAQQTAVDT